MNDLVSKGFSESRSASLKGIARSMIYCEHRKRNPRSQINDPPLRDKGWNEPRKKAHSPHESHFHQKEGSQETCAKNGSGGKARNHAGNGYNQGVHR